jgi:hypothetical protein
VLKSLPHVTTQLQTEEEAASQKLRAPVTRAEPKIVAAHSPIEKELLEYFRSPVAVEKFSNRTIGVTEDLMARAWALRHLEERYSSPGPNGESTLSLSSRQLLQTMQSDHRRAMRQELSELTTLLRPVLEPMVEGTTPESASESVGGLSLFATAQEVQRLTIELLSGAGSPDATGHNPPTKAVRDLLNALRGLEITLENQP